MIVLDDIPNDITIRQIQGVIKLSLKFPAISLEDVVQNVMCTKQKARKIMVYLLEKGVFNKEPVFVDKINPRIMSRIGELSEQKQAGLRRVSQRQWFSNPFRAEYLSQFVDPEKVKKDMVEADKILGGLKSD